MRQIKATLVIFFCISSLLTNANPIVLEKDLTICELAVKSDSSWSMKVYSNYNGNKIFLITRADTFIINISKIPTLIYSDSLNEKISIDPNGDRIIVKASITGGYSSGIFHTWDSISYGNYPGAVLPAFTDSISFKKTGKMTFYGISNSRQFGTDEMTSSTFTMRGTIYDRYNRIVSNQSFDLKYSDAQSSTTKSLKNLYEMMIYYRPDVDTIKSISLPIYAQTVAVKPFIIKGKIGDTIIQDIYILDELDTNNLFKQLTVNGKVYDINGIIIPHNSSYGSFSFNGTTHFEHECLVLSNSFKVTDEGRYTYTLSTRDTSVHYSSIYSWNKCIVSKLPIQPLSFNFLTDTTIYADIHIDGFVKANEIEKTEISLFPNPATTSATLVYESTSNMSQVLVYSSSGSLVKQISVPKGKGTKQLDVSSLDAGIYSVRITEAGIVVAEQQLIIIK